jgi:hypothetical protein
MRHSTRRHLMGRDANAIGEWLGCSANAATDGATGAYYDPPVLSLMNDSAMRSTIGLNSDFLAAS